MKKFDKEPVAWITRSGKHIPIFDEENDTDKIKKIEENLDKYPITETTVREAGEEFKSLVYGDHEGWLDYQEEDGAFILSTVEVKPEFQNKGIATKLMVKFYNYVNSKGGYLDRTAPTMEGKKYLTNIKKLLKNYYKNIQYAED